MWNIKGISLLCIALISFNAISAEPVKINSLAVEAPRSVELLSSYSNKLREYHLLNIRDVDEKIGNYLDNFTPPDSEESRDEFIAAIISAVDKMIPDVDTKIERLENLAAEHQRNHKACGGIHGCAGDYSAAAQSAILIQKVRLGYIKRGITDTKMQVKDVLERIKKECRVSNWSPQPSEAMFIKEYAYLVENSLLKAINEAGESYCYRRQVASVYLSGKTDLDYSKLAKIVLREISIGKEEMSPIILQSTGGLCGKNKKIREEIFIEGRKLKSSHAISGYLKNVECMIRAKEKPYKEILNVLDRYTKHANGDIAKEASELVKYIKKMEDIEKRRMENAAPPK